MGRIFQLTKSTQSKRRRACAATNSSCQTQWEALGGVLPAAAWQRSIARSKKIATATWWLQPQSEQQPRWSFASGPYHFLAEIGFGAAKHLLNSLAVSRC